jgi:hypothetical protein
VSDKQAGKWSNSNAVKKERRKECIITERNLSKKDRPQHFKKHLGSKK